ncbi:hypothetical protein J2Y54_000098 [Sphingomonas sp. BE123]|nr:hypothetical protein [Sphingomonas sp. BE123]
MRKVAAWVLAAAILINLALLITDHRLLVGEKKVNPGQRYIVEGYGDAGSNEQSVLVCSYWTGRSVVRNVLWYSSNNVMGRDQCPFWDAGSR